MTDTLTYPPASDLTTIGRTCTVAVYLDPATHTLYAHDGRWMPLGPHHLLVITVPPMADGESVLAALRACDAEISAVADCYVDGRWADVVAERAYDMDRALGRALLPVEDGGYLRHAEDASDWLSTVPMTWAELCEDAGLITVPRDDGAVRAVVEHLESIAAARGIILVNTERAVRRYLDHADG